MKESKMAKVLVLGIGNYSRGDDALGWEFIDALKDVSGIDTDYRYQLQIEDACIISQYDCVVLVDASAEPLSAGFYFSACEPRNEFSFSSHRIDPTSLLWLCRELYDAQPSTYVMAIEGNQWELQRGLSDVAKTNFSNALTFFRSWLEETVN